MARLYSLVDRNPGEPNENWVQRAVDQIDPELILAQLIEYLDARHAKNPRRYPPTWSMIADITTHGSTVSAYIADRFRKVASERKAAALK